MASERKLAIHTVIVNANPQSIETALTRSILGVTYKKFSRKKSGLTHNWSYNNEITKQICSCLYECLKNKTKLSMDDFKVKIDLTLKWDSNGKILGISDIVVSIYLKVGALAIAELSAQTDQSPVEVDLFYSDIDIASENLKKELPNIIREFGLNKVNYSEYDFLKDDTKTMREALKITRVPTVIIDDKQFVNPDLNKIRSELTIAFSPSVLPANTEFIKEATKPLVKELEVILNN